MQRIAVPMAAAGELKGCRLGRCWHPPTTLILAMDEKDIIERLGPPDNIIGGSERMRSRAWMCFELQAHEHQRRVNPGSAAVSGVRRRRVRDS
jgi:hypothetical protein